MMKIFLLTLLLWGTVLSAASAAGKPLAKVGLLSDTHVTKDIASCRGVKAAWQIFKREKCDLVINLGDIAHTPDEKAYRHYRNTVNGLFSAGEKRPQELYIYANHDRIGFPDYNKAFAAMKKQLEIPNDPYDSLILKGYPFLVFPQFIDQERYKKTIAEAIKKYPGKPLFVLDHIPPYNTIYHSKNWGCTFRRETMEKYPQAIFLSGHVHGSNFNELKIRQGQFTSVNIGSTMSGTAVIMEIFPEKILFRRYSLIDGKEYCTHKVWNIPWPFDPAKAPYRPEYRKEKSATPVFPAGAKLTISPEKKGSGFFELNIPAASPEVHYYLVNISKKEAKGKWSPVATLKLNSEYSLRPTDQKPVIKRHISEGYFDSHAEYRISAEPFNFYDKKGKALEIFWKAPAKSRSKILFESKDPMKELPFMSELEGGVPMKREGDFYIHDVYYARLVLPDRIWENIPKNALLRFTVDTHMLQKNDLFRQWTLVLRNPKPLSNAAKRIYTFNGESINRYVINFRMSNPDYRYYLLIREGDTGKIRFNYIKLEMIEESPPKDTQK